MSIGYVLRLLWIIGADPNSLGAFEKALSQNKMGAEYFVRYADSPEEIPDEHMNETGVATIIDAFHPRFPGFEGVKHLRERGFQGHIYLMGEPSTDSAHETFQQLTVSAYLPPYERLDIAFAAGLIHSHFYGLQNGALSHFLSDGGRAASTNIKSYADFNRFLSTISLFAGKFGVDQSLLKKLLLGITLPHFRTENGTMIVDTPFVLSYGMDPVKLLLSCSSFSRGSDIIEIENEFCTAVMRMKDQSVNSTIFPEFNHVLRSVENLIIFLGNPNSAEESTESMQLLSAIGFHQPGKTVAKSMTLAGFAKLTQSHDVDLEIAKLPLKRPDIAEAVATKPSIPPSIASASEESLLPAEEQNPTTPAAATDDSADSTLTLNPDEIDQLLGPASPEDVAPPEATTESETSDSEVAADSESVREAKRVAEELLAASGAELETKNNEINRLKELCVSMSADIKRLMKQRREPTSDKELKDAYTTAQEKIKKLTEEKNKFDAEVKAKTAEIESLKAQVKTLTDEREQLAKTAA